MICSELGGAGPRRFNLQIPIYVETPVRVVSDARSKEPPKTQRSDEGTGGLEDENLLGLTDVAGHMGSSYDPEILNWIPAHHKARVAEVPPSTPIKRKSL